MLPEPLGGSSTGAEVSAASRAAPGHAQVDDVGARHQKAGSGAEVPETGQVERQARLRVPVGPLRFLATMTSAVPRSADVGL